MPTDKVLVGDSTITKSDTIIKYKNKIVLLPGVAIHDTVNPCDSLLDKVVTKGNGRLTVKSDSTGQTVINCQYDSLEHVIDSLQEIVIKDTVSNEKIYNLTSETKAIKQEIRTLKFQRLCLAFILGAIVFLTFSAFIKKLFSK